ncbi:acid phosphatase (class A) [Polymorphobacter multimanifer]|uniref:Acid phosphatase n=1 Tax=Polymorphobacter multimanifer TaxID=1070431 RepID=A0A841L2I7_9SPHN|nr:phosphatase PAP2 family protein [Polymorphobacter multimanifer]MBB6226804.1 acid phosphatase (class A) [Polymorphobacter multimanifer]
MNFKPFVAATLLAAPALAQPAAPPAAPPATAMSAATTSGYLTRDAAMSILPLLPPPPVKNSPAEVADRYTYAVSASGVGSPAWKSAIEQLSIRSASFQQALGCAIGKQPGRATQALLTRAAADFVPPMAAAKEKFGRNRPFTTDKGQACDPDAADGIGEALGKAYPSGHAGIGWLWALILSDALPERADAIRSFGQATGDLRLACRVHWLSDVTHGRILATALYQKQAETDAFKADLAAAKAELAAAALATCP